MTYKQIIKAANQKVKEYLPGYSDYRELYKDGFADGAYWRDAQSPWISCKDRLPEYEEDVICCNAQIGAFFNHRSSNPNVLTDENGWCLPGCYKVDYWMPIPELPTNKTE